MEQQQICDTAEAVLWMADNKRTAAAIQARRAFVNGEIGEAELAAAKKAAVDAAVDLAGAAAEDFRHDYPCPPQWRAMHEAGIEAAWAAVAAVDGDADGTTAYALSALGKARAAGDVHPDWPAKVAATAKRLSR